MRLTEERAHELIAGWMKDCRCTVWLRPPTEVGVTHARVIIKGDYTDAKTIEDVKVLALGVRQVMEGLNALACCAGFDPEENAPFWRRATQRMGALRVHRAKAQRLTSNLFSRYLVTASSISSRWMAWGLAICLCTEPASPAMEIRRDVKAQLCEYLLRTPPQLDLVFGVHGGNLRDSLRALASLEGVHALIPATASEVNVVIGSQKDPFPLASSYKLTAGLVRTIRLKYVHVTELYGCWEKNSHLDKDVYKDVVAALQAEDTFHSMSLEFAPKWDADWMHLCSAVAYMQSLKRLDPGQAEMSTAVAGQWLAFALKSRHIGGLPQLTLSVQLRGEPLEAFVQAMRHEETFGCLIPEDLRALLPFKYFPLGTTANGAKGTQLMHDFLEYSTNLTSGG